MPSSFPVRNESGASATSAISFHQSGVDIGARSDLPEYSISARMLSSNGVIVFVDWRFHGFRVVIVKRKSFEDIFSSVPQDDGHKASSFYYSPIEIHQSTRRHGYDKIICVRQDLLQHHLVFLRYHALSTISPVKRDMGVEICFYLLTKIKELVTQLSG